MAGRLRYTRKRSVQREELVRQVEARIERADFRDRGDSDDDDALGILVRKPLWENSELRSALTPGSLDPDRQWARDRLAINGEYQ